MIRTNEDKRKKIVAKVISLVKKRLPEQEASLVKTLVPYYCANVPLEDLEARSVNELYGMIHSHWQLMYKRHPKEYKRRLFTPQLAVDGWESKHTILQFIFDDQPFLVDTLSMVINRHAMTTHLIIHLGGIKVRRNQKNEIVEILPHDAQVNDVSIEAPILFEIERQTDPHFIAEFLKELDHAIKDAHWAVEDWHKIQAEVHKSLAEIDQCPFHLPDEEVSESKLFLQWLLDDHFTFLGCRNYEVVGEGKNKALKIISGSSLGILRNESKSKQSRLFSELPPEVRKLAQSKQILILSKTNTKATVHSDRYTDYVGIKYFDKTGKLTGEKRFVGLYTSTVYHSSCQTIPVIRLKIAKVLARSGLPVKGHAAKTLLTILEILPRDDLFQANVAEIFDLATGIFQLQERRRIRLFIRKDFFNRFFSCLIYMPRDDVRTELRQRMEEILMTAFEGIESTYETVFTDSILAQLHITIRIDPHKKLEYDPKELEEKIIAIGRSWKDDLQENLIDFFGEEKAMALVTRYQRAFPVGYRETFSAHHAVFDIERIEKLSVNNLLEMSLYRPLGSSGEAIHFKLFHARNTIPLSDVLPVLENMGLRVIDEQPYETITSDGKVVWIDDFNILYPEDPAMDVIGSKDNFQSAFHKIWHGEAENDGFNRLVLAAQLSWREISVLRAYAKYLKQVGFTFSQNYMEETFAHNPILARLLVDLFKNRFNPAFIKQSSEKCNAVEAEIKAALDQVANLDEDRILTMFLTLIKATIRTNYYQVEANQFNKTYLSFKFNPQEIPELPLPKPLFEIFVYSPRFEGIHLRAGKVARGGIRWSDRREDFRTEILGLMKAQQVKNAVIVPAGAKGGFVPKYITPDSSREAALEEAIACYKNFIRGLLDLTDNLVNNIVVHPANTRRYDENDTYLVVAADKGTATFSDIANAIAKEYNYWLDDAFASGGSTGYDHKKMGITARGAWESVKNHFQELNIDIQNQNFSVLGIGDMSGDVFGNGMLLSEHIQLIGALNHQHIFIDPNPDPKMSYKERQRLFDLPRSTWEDYNPALISKGGGVFKRSAKAIRLSTEIKNLLMIKKDVVPPNELLRALLKMRVDLLWSAGIGTFVKASTESNLNVGDRANDAIRVNGNELMCRVIGEGGNLGLTQLGRIEYELTGGKINTDFIDNSGGVDCSDHEVNIKILLNGAQSEGNISLKHRNALLAAMTDEVSQLVIHNNYQQTRAITIAVRQSFEYLSLYSRYIDQKVSENKLNREIEFLPDEKTLLEHKALGKGLTRPEIAVLSAYSKIFLKEELLNSDLPADPYLFEYIENAFPKTLHLRYRKQMAEHRLCREIAATQLSNSVITHMGITFVYQMFDETRARSDEIVRAYIISREIFDMAGFLADIEALDYEVKSEVQIQMVLKVVRLIRRSVRWFLRNQKSHLDIGDNIAKFSPYANKLAKRLPVLLVGKEKESYDQMTRELMEKKVPEKIAARIAGTSAMYSILNVIQAAHEHHSDVYRVATLYFSLADILELDQFSEMINTFPVSDHWSVLARSAVKGDLDWQQRALTIAVLKTQKKTINIKTHLAQWLEKNRLLVDRWQKLFAELCSCTHLEYTMLSVAMRELLDFAQICLYKHNDDSENQP